MEPSDVFYDKSQYVITKLGNKLSKDSVLFGSDRMHFSAGKAIVEPYAVLRGDLSIINVGKYCVICERAVVRSGEQFYKGTVMTLGVTIGDHCIIGSDTIVEAQQIGNYVSVGKNCVIGKRAVLKDCCQILDDTVIAPGTIVASFSIFGGNPGRIVGQLQPTWPLSWGEYTKSYYRHFKPLPEATSPLRK